MQFQRTVLPNGLRLILIPMESVKSVTALVMVGAGSRYETKNNNGISHFLEHMAFKGTKKRPSAIIISSLIDGIGGEFNAFTSKETTGYYIKSSSNHIELLLDVLSDVLLNSKFEQKEIDKERRVIIEELNFTEDTPIRKIYDEYELLLYGDTAMGWDVGGNKSITQKIKREDFTTYLSKLYSPQNMTVVVAGSFNSQKVKNLVDKVFGKMMPFATLLYDKVVENQSKPAVSIKNKKTEQVHIALGVRTFSVDHPDRYVLSVLAAILGGGMSSRLFHEVREKRGLAYYIRTGSEHYQDCGHLTSFAGVDKKRIEEAIKVILQEYDKIRSSKFEIRNEELKKAKQFLKGHLVLELEDSRAVAGFFASQEILEKTIETPADVIKKIEKVTIADLERVAKKIFVNNRLNLAVIGPSANGFASRQRFKDLLEL